ncbi:MAG: tetratricopeptide repeat protein [Pirellulaceae bacterium]|nr:tetratricopeptide repeat protein [Pirellulaceae bacterium]
MRQRTLEARQHWDEAEQALGSCDFAAARGELVEFLRIRPGDAQAHFRLAQACRRDPCEDFKVAEEHLQAAYASGYSPAEINLENKLLAFQSTGESGESENALQSSLARYPESEPLILEALARGCIRSGRMSDANVWLDRWVKYHPEDWYARLWRGSLYQHLAQAPLAAHDYRQVLKARPERADIRKRLGLMLAASGYDYQEAFGYLEDALQHQADDADTLVALARCLHAERQPEKAKSLLSQVLAARPDHVEALISLSLIEIDLRHDLEALQVLRKLEPLVQQVDSLDAQDRLLRLDPITYPPRATKRLEKLLHLQGTVLRRLGRDGEARTYHKKLQRLQDDTAALTRAVLQQQERPRDADLLCRIGELQRKLGRDEEAENWLKKALQVNPDHHRTHQALSEYYETLDDPQARLRAAEHRRLAQGKM